MILNYKYTDKELKEILKNIVILVDTREQKNQHILDFFGNKKISYEVRKLDFGDYGVKIKAIPTLGIVRDIYINTCIEKKNSINELASSFKDRTRFEAEFIRSIKNNSTMFLLVEDEKGYENILKGNYRSEYNSKALMASLKQFEARYKLRVAFISKELAGDYIYRTLYYATRNFLIN